MKQFTGEKKSNDVRILGKLIAILDKEITELTALLAQSSKPADLAVMPIPLHHKK